MSVEASASLFLESREDVLFYAVGSESGKRDSPATVGMKG